jgi:hypothetical protein
MSCQDLFKNIDAKEVIGKDRAENTSALIYEKMGSKGGSKRQNEFVRNLHHFFQQ